MGFNTTTWGTVNAGQTVTAGIIWSPWNAAMTGGSDQGAQINLGAAETDGVSLTSTNQTKNLNLDGTVAYFVNISNESGPTTDFILQGGGF